MARQIHTSGILTPVGSLSLKAIPNLALQNFRAAKLFRDHVVQLETSHQTEGFGPFLDDIRSYCIACMLLSVASLEALINELFLAEGGGLREKIPDFENAFWGNRGNNKAGITYRLRNALKVLLGKKDKESRPIERMRILEKYQYALDLRRKGQLLDRGMPVYQNAAALIQLRDFLTHHKPARDPETHYEIKLEERLRCKFALSPFPDAGADFVVQKCMSAGAAKWAVKTCSEFIQHFHSQTGLPDKKKLTPFLDRS